MGRFSEFDLLVSDFMAEFGFTATYQHTTSTPNDATGGVYSTTISIPINAIRSELTRPLTGTGTSPQTTIQEGDLVLFVQPTEKATAFAAALSIDPANDSVVIAGVSWNIITVKTHAPDPSDVILYELYIRK